MGFSHFINFYNSFLFVFKPNRIKYIIYMCGNDVSTIASPNSDFYNLIQTQVPSKRIAMKSYPLQSHHAIQMSSMNLAGIRELSLQKCRITHETIETLTRLDLPGLSRLNLNDNEVGPIGCRALSSSQLISRLSELSLNNNKIKDVGLKALAGADLSGLQDLSLSDNLLTNDGVLALKGKLGSVECLSLGGNKLNDKSAAILASLNPDLIYYLKLSRNEFTDEGLTELLKVLKRLDVLLMDRNKIKQSKDKFAAKGIFLLY